MLPSITSTVLSFIYPRPILAGKVAPILSLTAHNGAWIRSPDKIGRTPQIFFFFNGLNTPASDQLLLQAEALYQTLSEHASEEVALFGITTKPIDQLRECANRLDLSYPLLYDPFAIEARRFGFSGRRFYCKEGYVVLSEQGYISVAEYGPPNEQKLFELFFSTDASAASKTTDEKGHEKEGAEVIDEELSVGFLSSAEAQEKLKAGYRVIDVRTLSEFEADHIPNSLHIPLDDLSQQYVEVDPLRELLFVCQTGGRARSAAEFISSIGGQLIFVVNGGMSEWNGPRKTGGILS